ncbi:MAG: type IV secretion system protein [Steroidobacteraceae bacterium]
MGFFETFWSWLNGQLATYIGGNTARIATLLEPAVVTLATVYVMIWGYLQLTGRIEEPVVAGVRRIVVLAVVLGGALHLWLYDTVIVDTFYRAPAELAAGIAGASDPVSTVDAIWESGGEVAGALWSRGGLFRGDFGFYLAGALVWLFMGLLCIYTMFLIALASIASAILLALGPLFIVMLLFDGTRRYFEAWLGQLATYAFINILTVLAGALLLQLVKSYAAQTAALGPAILTVDALDMVLVAMLVFLLMRQIMPIAAGLAGGVAPSTFGVVSRAVGWGAVRGRGFAEKGAGVAADIALGAWEERPATQQRPTMEEP